MLPAIKPWKVALALLVFFPLALIPTGGRAALVASRGTLEPAGAYLSGEEMEAWEAGESPLFVGGKESSNPLSTSDAVAIILTLLALGVVIGVVIQQQN